MIRAGQSARKTRVCRLMLEKQTGSFNEVVQRLVH